MSAVVHYQVSFEIIRMYWAFSFRNWLLGCKMSILCLALSCSWPSPLKGRNLEASSGKQIRISLEIRPVLFVALLLICCRPLSDCSLSWVLSSCIRRFSYNYFVTIFCFRDGILLCCSGWPQTFKVNLWPQPQKVAGTTGIFIVPGSVTVFICTGTRTTNWTYMK